MATETGTRHGIAEARAVLLPEELIPMELEEPLHLHFLDFVSNERLWRFTLHVVDRTLDSLQAATIQVEHSTLSQLE